MAEHRLTVQPLGRTIPVNDGQSLLDALQDEGIAIAADCGGEGLCRHCAVLLVAGEVQPVDVSRWSEVAENGHRWILACQARLRGDATIELAARSLAGDVAAQGAMLAGREQLGEGTGSGRWPLTQRLTLHLPPPTADDHLADWQRLERALIEASPDLPPLVAGVEVLRRLPRVLRDGGFAVEATIADRGVARDVMDLEPAAMASGAPLGLAVDVGTSTVVAQVVDLATGALLGQAAGTNAQKGHGADVITRIIWAEETANGPAQMQRLILRQIGDLADQACDRSACEPGAIVAASLSGNTTMTTFVLGAYPGAIRREPHVPLARDLPVLRASDLGLDLHPRAPVFLTPPVSGFVGGDITAGVLATGMAEAAELSLLVDVGTNGEIVLGNRDWLMCCSCSAGPAFEGVDIAAGVAAIPGAVDRIEYDAAADEFRWQTIGDAAPIGLCGTGLLEALAALFRGGLLDRQGHLTPTALTTRIRDGEDEPEVVIIPRGQSGARADIVLREGEIENLIRSKGAVYAGISCLLGALHLGPEDIERVYIAGSFGSRLRVEEAVTIGLLPDVPRERITFAGNTSLAGAYLTLMSRRAREQVSEIARKMTYLELSTLPSFMDEFVAALFLPHTDLNRFPSQRRVAMSLR